MRKIHGSKRAGFFNPERLKNASASVSCTTSSPSSGDPHIREQKRCSRGRRSPALAMNCFRDWAIDCCSSGVRSCRRFSGVLPLNDETRMPKGYAVGLVAPSAVRTSDRRSCQRMTNATNETNEAVHVSRPTHKQATQLHLRV